MRREHIAAAIRDYLLEIMDGSREGDFVRLYAGTSETVLMSPTNMAEYIKAHYFKSVERPDVQSKDKLAE
jgi:hypothetical protein